MKSITKTELESFLREVDQSFPVPLSQKQDLSQFAQKLCEKAELCYVQSEGRIIALAAGYTENLVDGLAYLSVVAVSKHAQGKGLGTAVVNQFLDRCRQKGIRGIHLYAIPDNLAAMKMYERLGFRRWQIEQEPRPEDAHLIFEFVRSDNS